MSKAVILKTDRGVLITGAWQCSNGGWFDAQGCFNYCNVDGKSDTYIRNQVEKLLGITSLMGRRPKQDEDWYKNRENFIDIEIPYDEVEQEYSYEDYI